LDEEPTPAGLDFSYENQRGRLDYANLALGLVGRHQAANAAVAMAALVQLQQSGWRIPEEAIRRGLSEVVFPARVEVLGRRPAVVVDVAHNPASVDALIQVLRESFSAERRLLVFAATQEKDLRGMLEPLLAEFDQVILTRYLDNPRAVPPEDLQATAAELTGRRFPVYRDPAEAWAEVRSLASPRDLVCVTGSFFLAAEIRRLILSDPPTLPVETPAPRST
jgi:dihydrofolate synthase/folylpolyglutamate synthase